MLAPPESTNKEVNEYQKMFPPRFFVERNVDLFNGMVGGDVNLKQLTEEAVNHVSLAEDTPITTMSQIPPSAMRLHPGHMHFVYNHGTQVKFAAEVMLDKDTAISAVYHALFGSPYFSEVNPEDYTNMYGKIEDAIKKRIAGGTLKSDWLTC